MAALFDEIEFADPGAASAGLNLDHQLLAACRTASSRLGGAEVKSIGVTSSHRGEGRTSIALGLAAVQSQEYARRTVLIEMDFGVPGLAGLVGLAAEPGFAELARGEVSLLEALQPLGANLLAVTAGGARGQGAHLLSQQARLRTLAALGAVADVVVCDLMPVLDSEPSALQLNFFEQLVLVIRSGRTQATAAQDALQALPGTPCTILNCYQDRLPRWLRLLLSGPR